MVRPALVILLLAAAPPPSALPGADDADAQAVPLLAATDDAAIRDARGMVVRVRGKVTRAHKAKSTGVNFLNFGDGKFTVVTFGRNLGAFPDGEPADAFMGKCVEVRGEVTFYKDTPQIELASPDQIRIVDEKAVAEAAAGTTETGVAEAPAKPTPAEDGKPTEVDPKDYFSD